ncbi:uncharacterized protein DUF1206 [Agromyces ramosus]|jgi:hypothetical protein|uniref:Uncharacterized protein DUF1206 n=1 Tax=Agromyces ramosus TaxID=33879 RepID=A0A4Q7MHR4_9MICO|nr:DUF1206 domain-containing protein [Agromyces ramosus]RZS67744.1 uncharacterized protein DUF1206 [Agromyces ramosus]
MNPETLKSTASAAQRSPAFRILARVGYVVLGIVHIIIGAIAISVAIGAGGGEADQGGAMEQISRVPFGTVVLWVIVLGLVALAVWQIAEAFLERDPDSKKKWGRRVKEIGTAVAYFAIAATALVYALGGSSDSSQSSTTFSATLLANPGGVVLLVLVGLVILGVGIAFIVRGIRKSFEKQLSLPAGKVGDGVRVLGVVGYVAKGIAIAVVGVLFVVAALTHDPEKAGGLDSALKSLAALPFGQVILWLVGAGLVVYGIYCFARARYARL